MLSLAVPVLLSLALLVQPAAAVELRLIYLDQDVRPYMMGEGTDIPSRPGMAIELVQRCASHVGGRVQLTRLPARRNIEEVRAGRQDGILGFRYSAERAAGLVYPMRAGRPDTVRYAARLSYSLYRRAGEAVLWDGSRIGGLTNPVAVSGSQLIAEALTGKGATVVQVETGAQMFGMLMLRRVDAVATLDVLGDRQMMGLPRGQVDKLVPPFLTEEFYVPVSQAFYAANRDFTERFWHMLGELRDATYAELTPTYLF
jgi:polar amino acid transport system substrate-binding protein